MGAWAASVVEATSPHCWASSAELTTSAEAEGLTAVSAWPTSVESSLRSAGKSASATRITPFRARSSTIVTLEVGPALPTEIAIVGSSRFESRRWA